MNAYQLSLTERHAGLLAASAISPDVARRRGYTTADSKAMLARYQFAYYQQLPPALLIPLRRVDGGVWGYQIRPDEPRELQRKDRDTPRPVKYETPRGQRLGIDFPPWGGALGDAGVPPWGDPSIPLLITEGVRKADSAVSHGLACVALLGVWGWRGTNAQGGKTAFPEWADLALDGRRVVLAYDSDVMTNPKVHKALEAEAAYLATKGAQVEYLHLPASDDGKTGLDDYLAANGAGGIWELARPEPPAPPLAAVPSPAPTPNPAGTSLGPEPEPWAGDPAALLDEVSGFLRAYVAFGGHAAVAVTLWVAHTHLAGRSFTTPRLAIVSPEKQCGKSRLLELLELLAAEAETLSDASAAYVFRRIGAGPVTILLDEADAIWKRGKADESAEALRSIVNAGHRRGATIGRCEAGPQGVRLLRFSVYAPAAIAAIGDLPDTIMDRAVIIRMRRRPPDWTVEAYQERTTRPAGERKRARLASWAAHAGPAAAAHQPGMPEGVTDRAADVWEPLITVADLAGGHWPQLAREACAHFVSQAREDTETLGTTLLGDIQAIFDEGGHAQLPTEHILGKLRGLEEAPWADWFKREFGPRDLAKLLKPYGIKSTKIRVGAESVRGYQRDDFMATWRSYLAPAPVSGTSGTSGTPLARHVPQVPHVPDNPPGSPEVSEVTAPEDGAEEAVCDVWKAAEFVRAQAAEHQGKKLRGRKPCPGPLLTTARGTYCEKHAKKMTRPLPVGWNVMEGAS